MRWPLWVTLAFLVGSCMGPLFLLWLTVRDER